MFVCGVKRGLSAELDMEKKRKKIESKNTDKSLACETSGGGSVY